MTDTITLKGLVATVPRHLTAGESLPITSFRLASSQSRYDRSTNTWVDGDTNWYTVTAFRRLALGAATSIVKGDRIIVTGRVRIREWKSSERTGTSIEIDADALGHDLTWGTAVFTRSMAAASAQAGGSEGAETADQSDEVEGGSDSFPPAGEDNAPLDTAQGDEATPDREGDGTPF